MSLKLILCNVKREIYASKHIALHLTRAIRVKHLGLWNRYPWKIPKQDVSKIAPNLSFSKQCPFYVK